MTVQLNDRDAEQVFRMARSHLREAARYFGQLREALDGTRVNLTMLDTAIALTRNAIHEAEWTEENFQRRRKTEEQILKNILSES